MKLQRSPKANDIRIRPALWLSAGGLAANPAFRRAGNQITRLSATFCLLAIPTATESSPLNWLLTLLFCSGRRWFHFPRKRPPQAATKISCPAPANAMASFKTNFREQPTFCKETAGFRNTWTPANSSAFERRRRLKMTHHF